MDILLYVLHVMVCVVLIVVVLLQRGKGADMGAMLGGGASNTVFGARGAGNFLTKLTTGCAVVFMLTSLSLAYLGNIGSDTLFDSGFDALEETPAGGAAPGASSEADEASPNALEEIPLPAAETEADTGADAAGSTTEPEPPATDEGEATPE